MSARKPKVVCFSFLTPEESQRVAANAGAAGGKRRVTWDSPELARELADIARRGLAEVRAIQKRGGKR